ncbi:MAG TPA: MBL fold metallo-hydrolase [Syntrophorhabdaceae bacterium]|nr:MBL fold metallo-hydrolase [Syntrophorhabdaceae bacterium]
MSELKIWFLDVGHGDCAYVELPNGARMMIDCGGYDHWPSRLLSHYNVTKLANPAPIPNHSSEFALDMLVITHPHGDHIADIEAIHDKIGFYMLTGNYKAFIDTIALEQIDFRKRGQAAAKKFVEVVKKYTGPYVEDKDRVLLARPSCTVKKARFIEYEKSVDFNDLSWFVSFEIGTNKVLFVGDMTSGGIKKILDSDRAKQFRDFVKGTTILKIPHHGRENGCSGEMFDAFGDKPLLCVASDEVLNDKNEGTSRIGWYSDRVSDQKINIDGKMQNRKVLTTRSDKDIFLGVSESGELRITTNCFRDVRDETGENKQQR